MSALRAAGYRRFYLYSALSIAVLAVAIAVAGLLALVLRLTGVGLRPSDADVSRAISLAIAILVFAVPVGGAHLWLIVRGLRDPVNAGAEARHRYLELWILVALVVELFTGTALTNILQDTNPEASAAATAIATALVAAVVGCSAAVWIRTTPPESPRWRTTTMRVGLVVLMTYVAITAASTAGAAGQLRFFEQLGTPRFGQSRVYIERGYVSGLWSLPLGMVLWAIALVRQWRWRIDRDRLVYVVAFYGIGVALLLGSVAVEAAALSRGADIGGVIMPWPQLAVGALLVPIHALLLRADRGRNGHAPVEIDRLLVAFPAVVGLALTVIGLGLGWRAFADHILFQARMDFARDDALTAAAVAAMGVIAYAPAWLALLRLTRDEPQAAIRRFALFTVICLALAATVVLGVASLYYALTFLIAVGGPDSGHDAVDFAVPALLVAAVFAAHLWLLLRDQRRTRTLEAPTAPADPLLELLEGVRVGRVTVADAATRVRGGL